jgi:hypothetical protein
MGKKLYGDRLKTNYETFSESFILESQVLNLNATLATRNLDWSPIWNQGIAMEKTFAWWKNLIDGKESPAILCNSDIELFLKTRLST